MWKWQSCTDAQPQTGKRLWYPRLQSNGLDQARDDPIPLGPQWYHELCEIQVS
jgi:hypothetical protein